MRLVDLKQNTPEWHAFRREHIGSSDIAAIVGLSPWKSRHDVWEDKVLGKTNFESTYAMERGKTLEPIARERYIKETSIEVEPAVCESSKHPFFMTSLDGLSKDKKRVVEIKIPVSRKLLELAKVDKIEDHYKCQCQWHLMVSEADQVDFNVFYADEDGNIETATIKILADVEFQQMLEKEAVEFWKSIKMGNEPPMEDEEFIEIDTPEFMEAAIAWKEANKRVLQFKTTYEALQDELEEAKKNLLEQTDGGNCVGSGLRIKRVDQKPTINWDLLKKDFKITEEQLKPYEKVAKFYFRISEKGA
jgi:putative phage-type endonuclease